MAVLPAAIPPMTMPPLFDDRRFYRDLFSLAIPIMLQNLVNTLVSMLSTVMIGRLGTVEIAAVGLGNQIFFVYNMFLFGIYSGGAIFTAQFWGKGDIAGIRKNLGFCMTLGLIFAIVFTLTSALFPEWLIGIYSRDPRVIRAGALYLRLFSVSFIPYAISQAFTITLRSVERVKLAIAVTVIALSINTVLNYFFIFGIGCIPAMGIRGAALSTVISRLVETFVMVGASYMLRYVPAGSIREIFGFNRKYGRLFFAVALPVILDEMLWSLGITIQNVIFARTTTDAIAAFSITGTFSTLTWVLFIGLGNGVAVMIGKKIGERDEKTARDYASRIVRFAPLVALGAVFILVPLSWLLPYIFRVNPETIRVTSQMFIILCCSYPFKAFNMSMIIGICRAGGDTVFCILYDIAILWLVILPLTALAAFVLHFPIWVIYLCVVMEDPLKSILGLWRFKTGKWLHHVTAGL